MDLRNGLASHIMENVFHFHGFVMITKIATTSPMKQIAVSKQIADFPLEIAFKLDQTLLLMTK